ncbi:MAG: NUMOD3 domain-containing DNA-binding protein [Dehalococcoidia bacterium]|nr:NUMOD3 domain-containing DNA-binding protein [Dehalococcoidia bacterium]
MGSNLVYGLRCPLCGAIRYIGKSTSGLRRAFQHRQPCRLRAKSHKIDWIKSLLASGLNYEVEVLSYSSREELEEEEIKWIRIGRAEGWPLTNLTEGGDGSLGHSPSPETRQRLSRAHRGQKLSPETIRKIVAARKGYVPSPETRAKIAEAVRTSFKASKQRLKVAASQVGKKRTPEQCANIRAGKLRVGIKPVSEETRAKKLISLMATYARKRAEKEAAEAAEKAEKK